MNKEPNQAYYRILDAAANRAGEGLRTLEEYARFALDDADLTEQLKRLRHDLTQTLSTLSRQHMLDARDTPGDVGTHITLDSEARRDAAEDIVAAAASRTQQSLRCLEEYSKAIDPAVAARVEAIRYRSYSLFATLELRQIVDSRRSKLAGAKIYVLIDAASSDEMFATNVQMLSESGADVLQLRDRSCDDRMLFERSQIAVKLLKKSATLFIVNDRADIAAASDADGVHVGQDELPVDAARQIVGAHRLVGLSTHSIEQARDAVTDGADYIGCGPVFPSQTKKFDSFVGTDFLREVASQIDLPAFAIGGIDQTNVDQVASAGFTRIAVTGVVRNAVDPARVIAELRSHLSE